MYLFGLNFVHFIITMDIGLLANRLAGDGRKILHKKNWTLVGSLTLIDMLILSKQLLLINIPTDCL